MDGYEMPWRNLIQENGGSKDNLHFYTTPFNQYNFAKCFLPYKHSMKQDQGPDDQCMNYLLQEGSKIAMQKKNLLVSSEDFDSIQEDGISMLKAYLSQWDDVSLILYHRRIYDRIISWHNQKNKKKWKGGFQLRDLIPMTQFIEDTFNLSNETQTTVSIIRRLEEHFDKSEIIVRNFHDDGQNDQLGEKFFCDTMLDAKHTCNAIRENVKKDHKPPRSNSSSKNLDYRFLVGGALKMAGFGHLASLNDRQKEERLVEAAQEYHMNMHPNNNSTTPSDFPRKCPPPDLLDRLWNVTLTNEMVLYPEKFQDQDTSYDGKDYKTWLREDFEKASRTSLCELDVESTLKARAMGEVFQRYLNRNYECIVNFMNLYNMHMVVVQGPNKVMWVDWYWRLEQPLIGACVFE